MIRFQQILLPPVRNLLLITSRRSAGQQSLYPMEISIWVIPGFTSQYNFANPNITEGQYFVGPNPQTWNAV